MAIATEPTKWIRPLGESADVNAIADEYKGENSISFKELFPPITQLPLSAGGVCPDRKDTNALFKILGDFIWYAQHGGVPTYSTDFDYHVGALVEYKNKTYICIVANGAGTTVKAPTDTSAWSLVPSMKDIESSVNASSATKLKTARTIALSGGVTGTATSFDGTANITIPVTSVTGSKVTGTVPAATKATQDGSGNTITSTYVNLSGTQTISGTKTFSAVTKSATPSASSNTTEVATTAWVITHDKSYWQDVATMHNNIYRGANLLSGHFSSISAIITAIAAGNFDDIFVGDYFSASYTYDSTSYTSKFRIAGINFFKAASGAWGVSTPHVVIVPDTTINARMNATNTTEGGYVGSEMYTTTLPKLYNALAGASGTPFYGHIKSMTESLVSEVNTTADAGGSIANWKGAATGWTDITSQTLTLLSESEIYGYRNHGTAADNIRCAAQLPMFRLKPETITVWGAQNTWLRSVAGSAYFCLATNDFHANAYNASYVGAVRPRFVIG